MHTDLSVAGIYSSKSNSIDRHNPIKLSTELSDTHMSGTSERRLPVALDYCCFGQKIVFFKVCASWFALSALECRAVFIRLASFTIKSRFIQNLLITLLQFLMKSMLKHTSILFSSIYCVVLCARVIIRLNSGIRSSRCLLVIDF